MLDGVVCLMYTEPQQNVLSDSAVRRARSSGRGTLLVPRRPRAMARQTQVFTVSVSVGAYQTSSLYGLLAFLLHRILGTW